MMFEYMTREDRHVRESLPEPSPPMPGWLAVQDAGSFRSVLRQVAQDQAQQGLLDEAAAGGWVGWMGAQLRAHTCG